MDGLYFLDSIVLPDEVAQKYVVVQPPFDHVTGTPQSLSEFDVSFYSLSYNTPIIEKLCIKYAISEKTRTLSYTSTLYV